jgi:hypothetical protein
LSIAVSPVDYSRTAIHEVARPNVSTAERERADAERFRRRTHQNDWIGLDWIGLDWIGLDWIAIAIGICVQLLRLRLGFVLDAGFRRSVPGATFHQALLSDMP